MQLVTLMALFLASASVIVISFNGYFFVAIAITVVFLAILVGITGFNRRRQGDYIAALLALGISSAYISLGLLGFFNAFILNSDAYVYDQIAFSIASNISWHRQINPFDLAYVAELGLDYGVIKQPGFYKVSGFAYTVGQSIGVSELHVQIPAAINIIAFAVTGYAFHHLLRINLIDKKYRLFLLLSFISLPYFLELLVWFRKDILLLALCLVSLIAIQERKHWLILMVLLSIIGTIRVPQALLLFVIWVAYERCMREGRLFKLVLSKKGWMTFLIGLGSTTMALLSVEFEIAVESFDALTRDRANASTGLSQILESNILGSALHAVLYPLPSLLPKSFEAVLNTLYAYLYWIFLVMVFFGIRKSRLKDIFASTLWMATMIVLIGIALKTVIAWKVIGFNVIEARFKLFPHASLVLLYGIMYARRMGASTETSIDRVTH